MLPRLPSWIIGERRGKGKEKGRRGTEGQGRKGRG